VLVTVYCTYVRQYFRARVKSVYQTHYGSSKESKMPLTAGQTSAFFEAPDQMGIPNATVVQLQQEGIDSVDSLADFDKTTIEQIAANLRRPAGRVPNNNPGMPPGSTMATPLFVFGAKSQMRDWLMQRTSYSGKS
jgi:hypothetical protein